MPLIISLKDTSLEKAALDLSIRLINIFQPTYRLSCGELQKKILCDLYINLNNSGLSYVTEGNFISLIYSRSRI